MAVARAAIDNDGTVPSGRHPALRQAHDFPRQAQNPLSRIRTAAPARAEGGLEDDTERIGLAAAGGAYD